MLPFPTAAVGSGKVAHPAVESGSVVEPAGVQAIEILVEHGEEPLEVGVRSSRIGMELDLGRFRLYQRTDLQPGFVRSETCLNK